MTDHDPTTLTEPLLLGSARRVAETHPHRHIRIVSGSGTSVGGFVAEVDEWVARIKADAYAAGLAAVRTPTASGDDLRDRLTAECDAAEDHGIEDEDGDRWMLVTVVRAALAASPAPVVPRPEAEDVAHQIDAYADALLEQDGELVQDYATGMRKAAQMVRAASLATDPEAGGGRG